MNQVLEFLSENYIYVAGGSLVLIIILIIIIALGNKKKKKIENAGMVNFNDMQVGSVTDVAQNMNQMNPNMPHTQSVSDVQLNNQDKNQQLLSMPDRLRKETACPHYINNAATSG